MKKHSKIDFTKLFNKHLNKSDKLIFWIDFVQAFRKQRKSGDIATEFESLFQLLDQNQTYADFFKLAFKKVFGNKNKVELMTDAGLINDLDFFDELKQRIGYKLVPWQPLKTNIQYALNQIFSSESDISWIKRIPKDKLLILMDYLTDENYYQDEDQFVTKEILEAVTIISQRMGGLALQTNVRNLTPEFSDLESPFIAIDNELNTIVSLVLNDKKTSLDVKENEEDFKQIKILIRQCRTFIDKAFENVSKYGISFKVNQTLLLIRQQLDRLEELYGFLFTTDNPEEVKEQCLDFSLHLISYNNSKNNIKKLIDDSVYNITYEITTYTGRTGEHYITSDKKGYFNMLKTASFGGIIVGFLCLFKLLISNIQMSEFGYALLYSLNYGLGFITIYLTGSTLATKQPAMTAATIAQSLEKSNLDDEKGKGKRYYLFTELFIKVFRSQFIAFVGNVFLAFPTALVLGYLYFYAFGYNVAQEKAQHLLVDLSITESPLILHAFIAGIFLFLSGIIAGNVANKTNYSNFYYRLSEHPFLKRVIGVKRTVAFSEWMRDKWAGIMSNWWFGVFMGCTAIVGTFVGLNLDIRHITFASGNLALGMFGLDYQIAIKLLLWYILGVGTIGFVNFITSFSLSILIALRSRKIPRRELINMSFAVIKKFVREPLRFFFPLKNKYEKSLAQETVEGEEKKN